MAVSEKEQSPRVVSSLYIDRRVRLSYLFLFPSFLLIFLFVYIPILFALLLSFYRNPGLIAISENLTGYFMDLNNLYMVDLSTFISSLIGAGFLPVILAITLSITTITTTKQLKRISILSDLKFLNRFLIAIFLNMTFMSYFIIFGLNFIILSGSNTTLAIANYKNIFTSPFIIGDFLRILLNTFLWSAICTFFHVLFGIFLAVLLNQKFTGRTFFRATFILPWAIPSFITALVWRNFIFNQDNGILGRIAAQTFVPGSEIRLSFLDTGLLILTVSVIGWIVFTKSNRSVNKKVQQALILLVVIVLTVLSILNNQSALMKGMPFFGADVVKVYNIKTKFFFSSDFYLLGYSTKTIFLAAILTNIWLGIPFMMMSFLAALQSIPQDLYEAARIDGASAWGEFRNITFPNVIPTLRTVALLGMIWTFNLFNVFYILSQNQTGLGNRKGYDIFITYIYYLIQQGLGSGPEFAAGAALSFVVFIILVLFSKAYQMTFPEEELND